MPRGDGLFRKVGNPKTPPETVGFITPGTGGEHGWFASKGAEPSEDGKWFRKREDAFAYLGGGDLGEIPYGRNSKRIIRRQVS